MGDQASESRGHDGQRSCTGSNYNVQTTTVPSPITATPAATPAAMVGRGRIATQQSVCDLANQPMSLPNGKLPIGKCFLLRHMEEYLRLDKVWRTTDSRLCGRKK